MAQAQVERVTLRRPKGLTASLIARLTASPRTRSLISKALRKPIFARDIWISGKDGEFVHFSLESTSKFDKKGYRTKQMGERGTLGILGSPKGTWDDVRNKSRVGLRLQGIRVPKERVLAVAKRTYGKAVRYSPNPLLMTVMNPGKGYKKNPVDIEYDGKSKGYRVFRTNPGKRRHYRRNGMTIPLWDNPEFGSLPVDSNPLDIATGMMPLYNDNPCRGMSYCNNPGHAHNIPAAEASGFTNNIAASEAAGFSNNPEENIPASDAAGFSDNPPGALPGYYGAIFNDNPRNPLTPQELQVLRAREVANRQDARDADAYGDSYSWAEASGRAFEDKFVAEKFASNPSGLNVGDFVRNLKRVMRGSEMELDVKQLGRVVSAGQFMGDTVYTVQFFVPDGTQKTFKFFAHEVKKEPSQITFEENPVRRYRQNRYSPAQPRALQKYSRPHKGKGGMPRYGELSHLAKQPASRPGVGSARGNGVRKVKMTIANFEAYLSRSGSPDEKKRYIQAKAAYRRFHKGADPEFITRKVVDVGAGKKIIGKSFAYSMGKSPFEPYITPKGSGKGQNKAYLHEYETMPEGLTVPAGKVVIKPLDGRAKITDWIHH
jgi:hypothetical protein